MLDHIRQSREAAIMIEATFLMAPKTRKGSGPVHCVGDRSACHESTPISLGACRLFPGSVKSGGTWQLAQFVLPSKIAFPRTDASSLKLLSWGFGAGIASW